MSVNMFNVDMCTSSRTVPPAAPVPRSPKRRRRKAKTGQAKRLIASQRAVAPKWTMPVARIRLRRRSAPSQSEGGGQGKTDARGARDQAKAAAQALSSNDPTERVSIGPDRCSLSTGRTARENNVPIPVAGCTALVSLEKSTVTPPMKTSQESIMDDGVGTAARDRNGAISTEDPVQLCPTGCWSERYDPAPVHDRDRDVEDVLIWLLQHLKV
jgi:hypothetical protein